VLSPGEPARLNGLLRALLGRGVDATRGELDAGSAGIFNVGVGCENPEVGVADLWVLLLVRGEEVAGGLEATVTAKTKKKRTTSALAHMKTAERPASNRAGKKEEGAGRQVRGGAKALDEQKMVYETTKQHEMGGSEVFKLSTLRPAFSGSFASVLNRMVAPL